MTPLPRFRTVRAGWALLLCGAFLLSATALGLLGDARKTAFSYLFAFAFWASLGVGSVLTLAGFHASKSRWAVALRRPVEAMALCCVPLAALFVPILLGGGTLFTWIRPPAHAGPRLLEALQAKQPYLNLPFYAVRSALYFAVWGVTAVLLWRWSRQQDERPAVRLAQRCWVLGAASLPFLFLALSFAGLDWVLSLDPLAYSTMFGFYFFAGAVLGALAAAVALLCLLDVPGSPSALLGHAHFVSLGKLLLAAVAFWAYIAFCQYMLTWIADVPDEVTFFYLRTKGPWRGVAGVLVFGEFVLPFFALLSRELKLRRRLMGALCVWMLALHAADVWWLVMPALHPDRPWATWTDFTALFGMGALLAAFWAWAMQGVYAVPVGDPYLRHSLRYHQI